MNRKYWFPAVICPKSIDNEDVDTKMKSPVIACPKCDYYDGTNIDEKEKVFTLCKYQSQEVSK